MKTYEPRSPFASPCDFERLTNPLQGGCAAPSKVGSSPFISKDKNFARISTPGVRRGSASQTVHFLVHAARGNKDFFGVKVKKPRKVSAKRQRMLDLIRDIDINNAW